MKDSNIVLLKEKKNIVWNDILEDAEEARGKLSDKCTIIVDSNYDNHFVKSDLSLIGKQFYSVYPLRGRFSIRGEVAAKISWTTK